MLKPIKKWYKTEFACYIRNFTPSPVRLAVPLGEMERRPKLTDGKYEAILEANRGRYSAGKGEVGVVGVGVASLGGTHRLVKPDLL